MLDIDGFFIHLNKAGHQMLEMDEDTDITQLRMARMFSDESASSFVKNDIPRAVSSGASHSELELKSLGGRIIPVSLVLIAHNDASGYLSHFSIILRDITPIKEAEAEREKLIQQLSQSRKLETLGRLAGGVAHDFNNLMTVIMGYTEISLLNNDEGKSCQAELEVILESAYKAARLSSQLLDFSSKRLVEPQVINLDEVLQNSLKLIKSMLGEGISVRLNTEAELWPIKMDRTQLDQILLNLTVNSRDALKYHGIYTMTTENRKVTPEEGIKLGLGKSGNYVVLRVSDTGCGMDQSTMDQIFDPFFTTKERGKGTGLGLSSVYGAVKQNKGGIHVSSTVGKGTIFEIYLPRTTQNMSDQNDQDGDQVKNEGSSGSEKILLVEDNTSVRNLLSKVLVSRGYHVWEAENGQAALDILKREKKLRPDYFRHCHATNERGRAVPGTHEKCLPEQAHVHVRLHRCPDFATGAAGEKHTLAEKTLSVRQVCKSHPGCSGRHIRPACMHASVMLSTHEIPVSAILNIPGFNSEHEQVSFNDRNGR